MIEHISKPWPWWAAGIVIGLTVPSLLILGNKQFGFSANLRHICASCFPGNIKFFKYNWRKELWNLFFAAGTILGAYIATFHLSSNETIELADSLKSHLAQYGIDDYRNIVPLDLVSWESLFTLRGFLLMVVGGFLVGFGTRYAGGCTSGHAIMGLSNLQWPSLIATCCFMLGGIIMTWFILPFILNL